MYFLSLSTICTFKLANYITVEYLTFFFLLDNRAKKKKNPHKTASEMGNICVLFYLQASQAL